MRFFYVYKSLAHPEINGFVAPHNLPERLRHIAEFKKITGSQIPWICDTMDNAFRDAFGGAPNGEFLIGPQGKIVRKRFWSNARTLRSDLEELVGKVENPTSAEEVLVSFQPAKRPVASGVVPRIDLPGRMRPLVVEPAEKSEYPYYAKLRVEGTPGLFGDQGTGKLYLGLYLDPLYRVHWNNRAGQIRMEVSGEGLDFSEQTYTGPEVGEDADLDPRQFLIDVRRNGTRNPLRVTVFYVVCDDDETFCHTVKQSYTVHFRADRNGGSRPGVFMPGMFANVASLDKNGDGRIAGDEFPDGRATLYLSHLDRNDDGVIDSTEIAAFLSMYNDGRGFDSPYNDGGKPGQKKNSDRKR